MGADINPMQAGLEARAIDFEKGCYIGQEVIAKIKYLGQVNRGLTGVRLEGNRVPPAGAIVEMEGEEVGSLTRAALSPTLGKILAFGLLHRKAMEPGTPLSVRDGGGEIAGEAAALPFYKNEALDIPAQSPPPG
jgi:folate-binding protein YgfZ